jgi:DNA-binding cell septation regulator SpoVG
MEEKIQGLLEDIDLFLAEVDHPITRRLRDRIKNAITEAATKAKAECTADEEKP